jgi:hypothetical protein
LDLRLVGRAQTAQPEVSKHAEGLTAWSADVEELASGFAWTDGIGGERSGDVAFVVTEDGVTGLIKRGGDVYEVTPIGNGLHAIGLKKPIDRMIVPDDVYELPEEIFGAGDEASDLDDRIGPAADGCQVKPATVSTITIVAGFTPAAEKMAQAEERHNNTLNLAAVIETRLCK